MHGNLRKQVGVTIAVGIAINGVCEQSTALFQCRAETLQPDLPLQWNARTYLQRRDSWGVTKAYGQSPVRALTPWHGRSAEAETCNVCDINPYDDEDKPQVVVLDDPL